MISLIGSDIKNSDGQTATVQRLYASMRWLLPESICDHMVQALNSLDCVAGVFEVCKGLTIVAPYLLWPKHPAQTDPLHLQ